MIKPVNKSVCNMFMSYSVWDKIWDSMNDTSYDSTSNGVMMPIRNAVSDEFWYSYWSSLDY